MKMIKAKLFTVACCVICIGTAVPVSYAKETPSDGAAVGISSALVEKLASDQFEVRSAAYLELKKWAKANVEVAPEMLHKVWKENQDPEVKDRCYELMKESALSRKFGRGQGFVGIMMDPVIIGLEQQAQDGIRIVQVLPNTPAQKAKLQAGDVIVGIDKIDFKVLPKKGEKVDVRSVFQEYVKSKHPDDVITLHLLRGGKKMDQDVTLMKRPASADAGAFGQLDTKARNKSDLFFEGWLKEMEKAGK